MNAPRFPAYLQASIDERAAEAARAKAFAAADALCRAAMVGACSTEACTLHLMNRALTRTDAQLFNRRGRYEERRLIAAQRLIGAWA